MATIVVQTTKRIPSPRYGKLSGVTTEPPDVSLPPLPEPEPDITPRIMLDARKLSLESGAQVTEFVGTGSGTASERTFGNPRAGSTWEYPTYDSDTKSLVFNSNQAMTNANETVVLPNASYLIVARITPHDTTNEAVIREIDKRVRVFTGSVADGFHGLAPRRSRFWMGAGLGNDVGVADVPSGWFVGVFVYDGSNSKLMTSDLSAVQPLTGIGTSGQSRISIGGNTNFSTPVSYAMIGNIALFAQYDKALTDTEITQLIKYYKQEFKI